MRVLKALCFVLLCLALSQQSTPAASLPSAPQPTGSVKGFTEDPDGAAIPQAAIVAEGPTPQDRRTGTSGDTGNFLLSGLHAGVVYKITVSAKGFANYVSPEITVAPGQQYLLSEIKLPIAPVEQTVQAETAAQIAIEEVRAEEQQRVLGIFPNFYTVYAAEPVPLSAGLKFKLATKASFDVATFSASAFLAGINQAAREPDYVEGAKGYGQRLGAAYAGGVTDVLFGGAVYPAIFHQDPRYYYQGTGSKKSRFLHAALSPFICKGDNGHNQFNISSVLGDLTAGAIANTYYPAHDRGVGLVFSQGATNIGGRIVNALAQEFVLSKYTTRAKIKN